ncbi:MAG: ABC transporter substrate-binding protein [Candidatus Promineifilaceae bacterium]|jgi:peptide/nickel transport system substrate-binding protein
MKKYWVVMLALLLALSLAACGGQAAAPVEEAEAPASEAESGDEAAAEETAAEEAPAESAAPVQVRIGWGGSPDSLNPGLGVLSEAYSIYELVYDAMYQLELDGTYSLELADDVQVSDDGTVWTFTIRDGITFHDGEPLTAEDIAFTYNLYQNQEDFPFLPVYTDYFESVEAPDEKTVVITLSEAIPNMESQLVFLYVLPEHIWSQVENPGEFENLDMVGSGPFKLVDYRQNEYVSLEAVKDHFLNPPKVDGAVFQTFDSQDALVQALRTGQVDMITEMPNTAVVSLRNEPDIQVVNGPPFSPSVADIIFNVTEPEDCPPDDGVCSGHPALRDRQVRLALAHATDKQQIIDVVLLGLGSPGLTLIPDSMGVFYDSAIEDYAYDIDLANQILDDAGYLDTDGDGVRETPDGQPLIFRMNWANDSTNMPRMAEILSATWSEIGVKTEQAALDPDALTSVCCPTFDYDVILWGWGSDPDPAFLLSVMTTDEIPTGTSESGYSNPEYDELYTEQATELDQAKRVEIIHRMQEIAHHDLPYIIPYYDQAVQAYRTDRFRGWITDAGKIALEDPTSLTVIEPVE